MKRLLIPALVVVIAVCARAGSELPPASQELFPMDNGITYHSPEYYTKLRAVLFDKVGWTGKHEFQFLKLPPFTPETLLTVSKRDTNYVAVVLSPEKQIWSFDSDTADLIVDQKEKLVPAPVAQRADRLWREMLIRARFAESGVYPDAVSYCFFKWIRGAGTLAAETQPRNNTKPSMLVGIAINLVQYVNAEARDEESILKALGELMDKLENELQKDKESSNQEIHGTQ